MTTFTISAMAYAKIKLHAFKYPHCEVTGILLANKENSLDITDAVPLFHQGTKLLPMIEVAFQQVQAIISNPNSQSAKAKNQNIVGYYEIPATIVNNFTITPFAQRIGDKINQIQAQTGSSGVAAQKLKGENRSNENLAQFESQSSKLDASRASNLALDESKASDEDTEKTPTAGGDESSDTPTPSASGPNPTSGSAPRGKILHSTLVLSMNNPTGRFQFFVKQLVENSTGATSYSDMISSQKWCLEEVREDIVDTYEEYEEMVDSILQDRLHLELNDFDNWLDNSKEYDFMNSDFTKLLGVYSM